MATRLDILSRSHVFGNTTYDVLKRLAEHATMIEVPGGEYVVREGDPGGVMYVIGSGRLVAVHSRDGRENVLGEIGPGSSVGETSLITGKPRSADVRAVRDSLLVAIDTAYFNNFVLESPAAALEIARLAIERSQSRPRRFDPLATLCLLPAFSGVDLGEAAEALRAAFADIGSVSIVREQDISRMPDEDAIRLYLEELEEKYRFLVFCANLPTTNGRAAVCDKRIAYCSFRKLKGRLNK